VPDDLRSSLAELRVRADQSLIDFLRVELDIGFTFARLAQTERRLEDEAGSNQAMLYAERVIETVTYFRHLIADVERVRGIEERLAELERLVSTLGPFAF
jgi:hypothetical protein